MEPVAYSPEHTSRVVTLSTETSQVRRQTGSFSLFSIQSAYVSCELCLLGGHSTKSVHFFFKLRFLCIVCFFLTCSFSDILNVTTPRSSNLQITLRTGGPLQFYTQRATLIRDLVHRFANEAEKVRSISCLLFFHRLFQVFRRHVIANKQTEMPKIAMILLKKRPTSFCFSFSFFLIME